MTFPQTDLTLVQRLAAGGSEEDWRRFLNDYWGAICRFALRWGARGLEDAEDATVQTFEAIWENRLLVRWVSNRSAKLRTLLCRVVRNILSHRHRVQANRDRLWPEIAEHLEDAGKTKGESEDAFYAAWVESVIQQAIEALAAEYGRKGQGDYVRVLYGRICRGLSLAQAAELLGITPANVDHYFRHARDRLHEKLQELVRRQVSHCCGPSEIEEEAAAEWRQLGQYLAEHGGLEAAIQRAYELLDPTQTKQRDEAAKSRTLTRIVPLSRPSSEDGGR